MANYQPKVGFVSLGCPKALVDSERILTQLQAEGYRVVSTYEAADLVVVNTCGFIDSAVTESLAAIDEALSENGKVIVTGCLGAKADRILETHPKDGTGLEEGEFAEVTVVDADEHDLYAPSGTTKVSLG